MSSVYKDMAFCDALSCLVVRLDRQMNVWYINRFGLQLLGYERLGQLFGQPFHKLLPVDEAKSAELMDALAALEQNGLANPAESDVLHSDGSRSPISWVLNVLTDLNAQLAPTVLVGFDASSIRKSESAARMFQTVSDNYTGSIVITDAQLRILYANPALAQMTGYPGDELIGKTPTLFKSGLTTDEIYRNLWDTLNAGGIWKGEFINRRKDGEHYRESKTIAAIRDSLDKVQYYFAIGEDLSQRQHYLERIETLLSFDQLTGLPNRNAFLSVLEDVLSRARREEKEATLLHIDIDNIFDANDSVGTDQSDQLIVGIAQRIKATLRQADQLARLSFDTFGILLGPHDSGIESDIRDVIERVMKGIREPVVLADKRIQVTASIGIASYPNEGATASVLLNHALSATERVKTKGGNGFFRFDTAVADRLSGRREVLESLRLAIGRGELLLHFQPQVSLFSGVIVGLEALVRWQHPQRGMIYPGEFIPQAEHSHLIIDLGEWVLHETCRQMRQWMDAGIPPIKVAINLAARHFIVPNLSAMIAGVLAEYRIAPRFLEVEITESAMMQDVAAAIRSTNRLKEIGVSISLDDFGTGYSSLAYLSRFPIDVVKIDQSFVQDITTNPVNAAIAQATIAMSHKLGKIVLAEGVENEEQMQYLRRNECDEMQGFFFSKPLPEEGVARLMLENHTLNLVGNQSSALRSTVLFVDDESNILSSFRRTLRREGYEILTAESAAEAFSILAKNKVQVVVSDQRMLEMNGTEFLFRVKSLYPETVRMVLSGYSEISAVTDSINRGAVYRFMLKPWDDEKLKEEITGALRHWRELYGSRNETD